MGIPRLRWKRIVGRLSPYDSWRANYKDIGIFIQECAHPEENPNHEKYYWQISIGDPWGDCCYPAVGKCSSTIEQAKLDATSEFRDVYRRWKKYWPRKIFGMSVNSDKMVLKKAKKTTFGVSREFVFPE